jgi:hypothetical protein
MERKSNLSMRLFQAAIVAGVLTFFAAARADTADSDSKKPVLPKPSPTPVCSR